MSKIDYRRFGIDRESQPGLHQPRGRHRAVRLAGEELEPRALCTVGNLTANVSPSILRQINPRNQPHSVQVAVVRPVTLAGSVTESAGIIPALTFRVVDQNGRHMPSGAITPQFVRAITPEPVNPQTNMPEPTNLFFFSFRFGLNRSRLPGQASRQYTVDVTAQDSQSSSTIAIPVATPIHRG